MAQNATPIENFQSVLNIFSIHTDEKGRINDKANLVLALNDHQDTIKNSQYFGTFEGDFDAQKIIDIYDKKVMPALMQNH